MPITLLFIVEKATVRMQGVCCSAICRTGLSFLVVVVVIAVDESFSADGDDYVRLCERRESVEVARTQNDKTGVTKR